MNFLKICARGIKGLLTSIRGVRLPSQIYELYPPLFYSILLYSLSKNVTSPLCVPLIFNLNIPRAKPSIIHPLSIQIIQPPRNRSLYQILPCSSNRLGSSSILDPLIISFPLKQPDHIHASVLYLPSAKTGRRPSTLLVPKRNGRLLMNCVPCS